MVNWLRLQNGSDIRGVALEGVRDEKVNLNGNVAMKLGQAFAAWLETNGRGLKKVAVGTDSRISGNKLKKPPSMKILKLKEVLCLLQATCLLTGMA